MCESQGGHPRPPVLDSPYGLHGHKATFDEEKKQKNLVVFVGGGLIF